MSDQAQRELEAIKKLLILLLVKLGATSDELEMRLGLSAQRVRQLVATANKSGRLPSPSQARGGD